MPALEKARRALENIDKNGVAEIRYVIIDSTTFLQSIQFVY